MVTVEATDRAAQPASDRVFAIEDHWIDAIPESDRHGSSRELFSVWFAGNVILELVRSRLLPHRLVTGGFAGGRFQR